MPESTDLYETETSHGAKVPGGKINGRVDMQKLRTAIPAHCFKPCTIISLGYVIHDLAIFSAILGTALYIEKRLNNPYLWFIVCYLVYPYVASLPLTGLWVLAHEAGHGAFSTNSFAGNTVGFILHSALMSPYFAWRSSHHRHHQYANNTSTDLNYVPPMREEYTELFRGKVTLDDMTEDAPIVILLRILLQQFIGWPWYLLAHITAGSKSSPKKSRGWWDNSHFSPTSSLFHPNEFWNIVISDLGLLAMAAALYLAGLRVGSWTMVWTYLIPLIWVNHWIVMVTYLHHTSPDLPKYTPEAWTYIRGALATVDRKPGMILERSFHHIIDLHVVHHLFPRIPHYHAKEATEAIKPLLGSYYHVDKSSYWAALWKVFTACQWVEPDAAMTAQAARRIVANKSEDDIDRAEDISNADGKGILWYRPGRMPGPAVEMRA